MPRMWTTREPPMRVHRTDMRPASERRMLLAPHHAPRCHGRGSHSRSHTWAPHTTNSRVQRLQQQHQQVVIHNRNSDGCDRQGSDTPHQSDGTMQHMRHMGGTIPLQARGMQGSRAVRRPQARKVLRSARRAGYGRGNIPTAAPPQGPARRRVPSVPLR